MVVRIRFGIGSRVRRTGTKNQRLALAFASLLVPVVLGAWVLAFWRLGSDLRFVEDFAITTGLFSHWQVWIAIAAGLNVLVIALDQYGTRPQPNTEQLKEAVVSTIPVEALTPEVSAFPESKFSLSHSEEDSHVR